MLGVVWCLGGPPSKGCSQSGWGEAGWPDGGHGLTGLQEAVGLVWGPHPFRPWLQLIWSHLWRNVCQENQEISGVDRMLPPPAASALSRPCPQPHTGPWAATILADSLCSRWGWDSLRGQKATPRVSRGTLSSSRPPSSPPTPMGSEATPWQWAYLLITTDGPPPPLPSPGLLVLRPPRALISRSLAQSMFPKDL